MTSHDLMTVSTCLWSGRDPENSFCYRVKSPVFTQDLSHPLVSAMNPGSLQSQSCSPSSSSPDHQDLFLDIQAVSRGISRPPNTFFPRENKVI